MKLIRLPPDYDAIQRVALNLEQLDVLEWYYSSGPDISGSLQHAVLQSQGKVWVAALDDESTHREPTPVALFGVVTSGLATGAPWAVMTEELRDYPGKLMALAKHFVSECQCDYDLLHIRVWIGHQPAIRFIESLGFGIVDVERSENAEFLHYQWVAKDV